MQQTSGSSCSNRTGGGETAVDEVAVDVAAVDEVAVDEVVVVASVSFLLMVCEHCDLSNGLEGTVVWLCFTVRQGK